MIVAHFGYEEVSKRWIVRLEMTSISVFTRFQTNTDHNGIKLLVFSDTQIEAELFNFASQGSDCIT